MYAVRRWSVRHARGLNAFYRGFESLLVACDPLWRLIGYQRLERPVAAVERVVVGIEAHGQRVSGRCHRMRRLEHLAHVERMVIGEVVVEAICRLEQDGAERGVVRGGRGWREVREARFEGARCPDE